MPTRNGKHTRTSRGPCSFDKERGTMFSAGAAKMFMMVAFEDCGDESGVLTGIWEVN
jgi:hypothetical protein